MRAISSERGIAVIQIIEKLKDTAGLRVYGCRIGSKYHRIAALPMPSKPGSYRIFFSTDGNTYDEAIVEDGSHFSTPGQKVISRSSSRRLPLMLDPAADVFPYRNGEMKLMPDATITEYRPLPPVIIQYRLAGVNARTGQVYLAILDALTRSWLFYMFDKMPNRANPVNAVKLKTGEVTHPHESIAGVVTKLVSDGNAELLLLEAGGQCGQDRLNGISDMYNYGLTFMPDGTLVFSQY